MSAPDPGLAEEERALVEGAGAVVIERDVVQVEGPDAASFLQGQLSQDVESLEVGASRLSFLLQPQGKLDALLRVTRSHDSTYLLDTDSGFGEAVISRLNRFKLRVKCELALLPWRVVAVRGAAAGRGAEVQAPFVLESWWPAWPGYDLAGTAPEAPDGVRTCRPEAYEVTRIAMGAPRMGVDLDGRTIPAESGLVELAASFTKGCYTGQELVARIDSRGHVNRHLRRLSLEPESPLPPPGASISALVEGSDREVGSVTSAALSARLGRVVALGYVRREVEPPAEVLVSWDSGATGGAGRAGARVET